MIDTKLERVEGGKKFATLMNNSVILASKKIPITLDSSLKDAITIKSYIEKSKGLSNNTNARINN